MATKIILKKSSTGGAAPLTSDLDQSELAINLSDRKIYTKDNSGAIVTLNGAYVDSVAPSNPAEGDLWYDTANNLLKAYNGSSFESAGYQTLGALEDVTLTTPASGHYLKYNGVNWVNSDFETDAEALFSATNTGTGHGDLSYANGVYTFDRVTAAEIRGELSATTANLGSLSYNNTTGVIAYTGVTQEEIEDIVGAQLVTNGTHTNITVAYDDAVDGAIDLSISDATIRGKISVTDAGGDGSLSYNSGTGVITYTGPSASEVRAHFSGGDGISYDSGTGVISADFADLALSEVSDVTITTVADNEVLAYDSTSGEWINQTAAEAGLAAASHTHTSSEITDLETTVEGYFSATNTGTGYGDLSYANGVYTFDRVTDAEIRGAFTAGTGVTISSGQISIGQDVATTSNVTFADVTMTGELKGPATFTIDPAAHGNDTGTVVIAGNLTVNGTTTTVSSNQVNIGDSIILLNSDETGVPSQNGGFEIERGTSTNVQFVWNEADDAWDMGNETLQNVVIDGGSY